MRTAASGQVPNLKGLVVVDVVEGASKRINGWMGGWMGGPLHSLTHSCVVVCWLPVCGAGTALEALPHMRGVVERMPSSFASPHEAVEWAVNSSTSISEPARICLTRLPVCVWVLVQSGTLLNRDSARISVPSQLVHRDDRWSDRHTQPTLSCVCVFVCVTVCRVWRCNLMKTAGFWDGWFRGLSGLFLQSRCVKLLLLAGTTDTRWLYPQLSSRVA